MKNTESSSASPDSADEEGLDTGNNRTAHRFGLVLKSILAMSVVGLVPLISYSVITLKQQSDRIGGEAEHSMRTSAELTASQVDEWFDKSIRVLQAAGGLPAINSMKGQSQVEVLTAIQQAYPWMYLVFTIGMDGQNVARSDEKPLVDYSDRQYFKDIAFNTRELAWETLIGRSTRKPALVLALPIKQNNRVVGVIASAMLLEELSRIVARSRMGQTGFAFLVDEKGKVIAHPREEYVLSQTNLTQHPLIAAFRSKGQARVMPFESDGKQNLGYVQGNRMQWGVAFQQEEDEVYAALRQMRWWGVVLLLGSAIFVIVIARVFAGRLVRPILEMTRAADAMSMGALDKPIEFVNNNDELGLLGRSLERLRKSMKIALDRLARA